MLVVSKKKLVEDKVEILNPVFFHYKTEIWEFIFQEDICNRNMVMFPMGFEHGPIDLAVFITNYGSYYSILSS